ncbi:hypothetical protein FLONG3_4277 [Fusarium longipes]|uniref:Uncharacterized protein n=1 Tax=Fusarium longipes TaxID=694270 RepID=A0A395SZD9_9HYPO|nr:hypothetical protein FLONG3_4277 [Fusarium longipes]
MVYHAFLRTKDNCEVYRYVLTAPSPEVVDEWWREASQKFDVKRLSPDFYIFDIDKGKPHTYAPEATRKIIFTLLNDIEGRVVPTFNQPVRTDVVSGNSYYIRSKTDHELYWLESGGFITASKRGRTRFTVRLVDPPNGERNARTVLLDTDEISLGAQRGKGMKYIGVDDDTALTLGGHTINMHYSDLKRSFLAEGLPDEGGDIRITKEDDQGEEWELVR